MSNFTSVSGIFSVYGFMPAWSLASASGLSTGLGSHLTVTSKEGD